MRKILLVSGIVTIVLLMLLLSGWAVADDKFKEAVIEGNRQFEADDYNKALETYEAGLTESSENKVLNYNAAQMAYLLGEYEKAAQYYEKAEVTKEKFLNHGNIYFRAGDAVEDVEQKAQLYGQALQIYENGIIKYPQDVPLKYNYELVKEKLLELLQESQQNEKSEEQEGDGEEQESEGEQQEGDSEQQESEGEQQEGDSEQQESEGEQQEGDSEQQESEGGQQEGDDEQQNNEEEQGYSDSNQEAVADEEAIQRILQMLESQEEQSLKNNQEITGGKEGKYDW